MKKIASAILAGILSMGLLAACGKATQTSEVVSVVSSEAVASQSVSSPAQSIKSEAASENETSTSAMKIAGLKGPTTMGMVKLMDDAENGVASGEYEFEMFGAADEIVPKLVSGEIDAAAVPANLASVLYNKTQGGVQVAAINTLGVLYVVQTGNGVKTVEDLRKKTVYSTGKGTTPEFVMNYILKENGIEPTEVDLVYKSEATEIAAILAEGQDAIAVLPQPYATAVQMQNENVSVALDLTQEWEKVAKDSALVTGVLLVRKEFAQQNKEQFDAFLESYEKSISFVTTDTTQAAELVAKFGIVEKAPIAAKALPACNITFIKGTQMQEKLSGYLEVLFKQNPEAVGGVLPENDFYYGV